MNVIGKKTNLESFIKGVLSKVSVCFAKFRILQPPSFTREHFRPGSQVQHYNIIQ